MDRLTLSKIDEELESSEVAALRFLCREVVNRKRLENVVDGKGLFLRLEERGLLDSDAFLCQLLQTIGRNDLVRLLRVSSSQFTETDASPPLSDYSVMLYHVHDDLTLENLEKMKFLLDDKLGRGQIEKCETALDIFMAMEKKDLLSNTNLNELYVIVREFDLQLAETIHKYMQRPQFRPPLTPPPHNNNNEQNTHPSIQTCLSITETQPSCISHEVFADSNPTLESSSLDETDYYPLIHMPHGLCVVINNEKFIENSDRRGSHEDERALRETFTALGFKVEIHKNLDAAKIKDLLTERGKRNFLNEDALVVCVLSHGLKGCVYGSDDLPVSLQDITKPFTSLKAPSLAGKPKLFFIQACQGTGYQRGSLPFIPKPGAVTEPQLLEEDAGPVQGETVPWDADFLLGMATVPECKSFRSVTSGSIYIQELCKQLNASASSSEMDDILSVLTRVNRNVSRGVYLNYKQMPEPKYTLTKKLVLRYV